MTTIMAMDKRGTAWSITINNPTAQDEEEIALARQKGWKVEGQLEKGESGTPHLQLLVSTPQVRFAAVKKTFPRAHIELARNVAALKQYVHKEETREGELKQSSDNYPSLQKVWDLFSEWITTNHKTEGWKWIDADSQGRLALFDKCIADLILQGYVVETLAVNPQVRSAVKLYGHAILERSVKRLSQDSPVEENGSNGSSSSQQEDI